MALKRYYFFLLIVIIQNLCDWTSLPLSFWEWQATWRSSVTNEYTENRHSITSFPLRMPIEVIDGKYYGRIGCKTFFFLRNPLKIGWFGESWTENIHKFTTFTWTIQDISPKILSRKRKDKEILFGKLIVYRYIIYKLMNRFVPS